MFSENGNRRNSVPPSFNEGENRKALFRKELLFHKKEFSASCLQSMLKMLEVRRSHASTVFSKGLPSFLKQNLPHCFLYLENGKADAVKSIAAQLVPASLQILSCETGVERFKWAMEQAALIAESESAERIKTTLPAFFRACANVCSMGRETDWAMFISTCPSLHKDKSALFAAELSASANYPELYEKLSRFHSKLTREKIGAAFSY